MDTPKPVNWLLSTRPCAATSASNTVITAAQARATRLVQGCTTACCTGPSISAPNSAASRARKVRKKRLMVIQRTFACEGDRRRNPLERRPGSPAAYATSSSG